MLTEKFFYPVWKSFDKAFFKRLKKAVKEKYEFLGQIDEKSIFLKRLLCYQMLKDYRQPLYIIDRYLSKETDIKKINDETGKLNLKLDCSWVVW